VYRYFRDQTGISAAEYVLILFLIALAAIGGLSVFGTPDHGGRC